jgi:hypothetical protein
VMEAGLRQQKPSMLLASIWRSMVWTLALVGEWEKWCSFTFMRFQCLIGAIF